MPKRPWNPTKRRMLTQVVPLLRDYADILEGRGEMQWAKNVRELASHFARSAAKRQANAAKYYARKG